ncbi:MAG: isoprenylcysteine carboxylmethyltransferase family protein [Phycisphaerae bacterium]|nr:isoprenylcysteine carboxylmethyltransferase family protein [Phycisphaerae bacterium]
MPETPIHSPRKWPGALLAALAVVLSVVSLAWFGLFMLLGAFDLVPLDLSEPARLAANLLLSVVFFIQHSGMIRESFQRWLAARVSREHTKSVYGVVSGAFLIAVIILWQGPLTEVWAARGALYWAIRGLFGLALAIFGWSALTMIRADASTLRTLALAQPVDMATKHPLISSGPYGWVRHPQYLAALLMIWSGPVLTTDRIAFNVIWSAWVVVAVRLEERDLVRRHGQAYRDYQTRVPMLLPLGRGGGAKSE